jgi:hypothetical protein
MNIGLKWALLNTKNVVIGIKFMTEPILISEKYMFVIDTDSYVEEFGSQLCSYCTGFDDECSDSGYAHMFYMEMGLEDDEDELSIDKNPFKGSIEEENGEDGSSAWNYWFNRNWGIDDQGNFGRITPENYGNYTYPAPFSLVIFFESEPTDEQIQIIKGRATKFFSEIWPKSKENEDQKKVEIEGFRLIKHTKYGEEKFL